LQAVFKNARYINIVIAEPYF